MVVALGAVLILSAAPAWAQTFFWCFDLTGMEEVPPADTTATGRALVSYDPATNLLEYNISFSGLSSPETMAHIHGFAPRGVPAGILYALPLGSSKFGQITVPDAHEADLLFGLTYVNVHSVNFANGEIRGQIDQLRQTCNDTIFRDGFEET
jgi:hypothetical protein